MLFTQTKIKDKLRTLQPKYRQKLRTSQPEKNLPGPYKKKKKSVPSSQTSQTKWKNKFTIEKK